MWIKVMLGRRMSGKTCSEEDVGKAMLGGGGGGRAARKGTVDKRDVGQV